MHILKSWSVAHLSSVYDAAHNCYEVESIPGVFEVVLKEIYLIS